MYRTLSNRSSQSYSSNHSHNSTTNSIMYSLYILFQIFLIFYATIAAAAPSKTPTTTPQPPQSSTPYRLCTTDGCRAVANMFRATINQTINPCEDFFQYTCDGYVRSHPIPEYKSRYGVNEQAEEDQTQLMHNLLEHFVIKIQDNNDDHQHSSSSSSSSSMIVKYAVNLYRKCLAVEHLSEQEQLSQLKVIIAEVLGEEWNIGQKQHQESASESASRNGNSSYKWYKEYVRTFTLGGVSPIFDISIEPDLKNVTKNLINLDPASLGLGDKDLSDFSKNPALIDAYKRYMHEAAVLLSEHSSAQHLEQMENSDENETPQSQIIDANMQNSHTIDLAQLDKDIEDIVEFESILAKSKLSLEDQRDPDKVYNKLTLNELNEKTGFNWLENIFNPIWHQLDSSPLTGDTEILISDLEYIVNVTRMLESHESNAEQQHYIIPDTTLRNYFGWFTVLDFGPISSEAFRNVTFRFAQINTGVTKQAERWRACLSFTDSTLSWALSRLFVDQHFKAQEKAQATVLIDTIQDAYRELIEKNQWLDGTTKQASISKLNHVKKNVAYPDWLLNNTELDKFFALPNNRIWITEQLLEEKNFLKSFLRFLQLQLKDGLTELNKPIDLDKNWGMPPFIVNAEYDPEQNSITIPAGQLVPPFFSASYPASINYGNIGATVGHELTHGLDDEGRQFDEQGNLHDWWSQDAIERYENRTECFVQQYGDVREPLTNLTLNGDNTLGENIADNGGLSEAFLAFHKYQSKHGVEPRVAGLEQYSHDQLFFLSYGYSWCSVSRKAALRNQIEYDPHSPPKYRVNIVVSNSPEFARAFNCPVGSPMNPEKKCILW